MVRTLKVLKPVLLTVGLLFFFDWAYTGGMGNYSAPLPYAVIALTMAGVFSCHLLIARATGRRVRVFDFGVMLPVCTLGATAYNLLVHAYHLPSEPFVLIFWVSWFVVMFGPENLIRRLFWRSSVVKPDEDPDAE
jgi:hypothetical protein